MHRTLGAALPLCGALLAVGIAACTVGPPPGMDSGGGNGSDSGGLPGTDTGTAPGTDAANPGTDSGSAMAMCAPAGFSACANTASVVRGVARLGAGVVPPSTSGTLYVALSHVSLGSGAAGGVFHTDTTVPVSDVTAGVPFSIDMCSGGEMWSQENGQFNLVVIFDANGNQSASNLLADPGEPSHREVVELSCTGTSPCLDVALDCTSGGACTSFADSPCACPTGTCTSIFAACSC